MDASLEEMRDEAPMCPDYQGTQVLTALVTADAVSPFEESDTGKVNEVEEPAFEESEGLTEVVDIAEAAGSALDESHFDFAEEFSELKSAIGVVSSKLEELSKQFNLRIARSDYEDRMLKQYSDEIQQSRSDLYKKITLPLIREISEYRDMICSTINRARTKDGDDAVVKVSVLETYRDMLESSLSNYGVGLHSPKEGDDFTVGFERVVGKVATGDFTLDTKLAIVASDGYVMDGKAIVQAKVKIYEYSEELAGFSDEKPSMQLSNEAPDQQVVSTGQPLEVAQTGSLNCSSAISPVPISQMESTLLPPRPRPIAAYDPDYR
ncbi:MAG: nucleotide exchange factor GrpE [Coriobacteriales bacterium]|nr:nucleotide exchange factor GrpE [Coriobacteriales bacterium]